mgnify:CR=1 FL=1
MLKLENIISSYGVIKALKGISIEINEGELVTLIGANGAGKSTILKAIIGLVKLNEGNVYYKGERINGLKSHEIIKKKISLVPEGRKIFADMTVEENLELGAIFRNDKKEIQDDLMRIYETFPRLRERCKQLGGTLSGGEQQMLALGRALMSKPELILMDEPSMGLAPIVVEEVFRIIKTIKENGTTILLVEQNAKSSLKIADRAYLLSTGRIVLHDKALNLLNDKSIVNAYLGGA